MLVTLLGRLAQFGIMFLSVKLMTSLLTPIELGRVALVTASVGFFALFLLNPVGMFINRKLHIWYEQGNFQIYYHWFVFYVVLVATIAVISVIFFSFLGPNLIDLRWTWVVVLFGGALIFNAAIQVLVPSLNMLGRSASFTILNVSTLMASIFFSYLACIWWGATAEHWLIGPVIAQAIFSIVAYRVFFEKINKIPLFRRPTSAQVNSLLYFCWPISIAAGFNWMHMQGYRFVIADRFGLEEFGYFVAGYNLAAAFLSAGETILTTWFQPRFYSSVNSINKMERDAAWATYAARMIPATLLCSSGLVATSDLLPRIILGPMYHDVGYYLMLGCFAELARMWVSIYVLHAHKHMSTRKLILPSAVGALVTGLGIFLSIFLLDIGIAAAPVVVCIACILVVILLWYTGPRLELQCRLPVGRIFTQALVLFSVAIIVKYLISNLTVNTMQDALLVGLIVFMAWLIFTFLLRNDLFGDVSYIIK